MVYMVMCITRALRYYESISTSTLNLQLLNVLKVLFWHHGVVVNTIAQLHSIKSGSAMVQILLTECWRFAIMRISESGHGWKQGLSSFLMHYKFQYQKCLQNTLRCQQGYQNLGSFINYFNHILIPLTSALRIHIIIEKKNLYFFFQFIFSMHYFIFREAWELYFNFLTLF